MKNDYEIISEAEAEAPFFTRKPTYGWVALILLLMGVGLIIANWWLTPANQATGPPPTPTVKPLRVRKTHQGRGVGFTQITLSNPANLLVEVESGYDVTLAIYGPKAGRQCARLRAEEQDLRRTKTGRHLLYQTPPDILYPTIYCVFVTPYPSGSSRAYFAVGTHLPSQTWQLTIFSDD